MSRQNFAYDGVGYQMENAVRDVERQIDYWLEPRGHEMYEPFSVLEFLSKYKLKFDLLYRKVEARVMHDKSGKSDNSDLVESTKALFEITQRFHEECEKRWQKEDERQDREDQRVMIEGKK